MFNAKYNRFRFDQSKAVEVLLYITAKVPDKYKALKILYFADMEHLRQFGRLINGDCYAAMKHGPVPSESYDILKNAANPYSAQLHRHDFEIDGNSIIPQREANLDYLSESDIACIDEAIAKYKSYSFGRLHRESAKGAYKNVQRDDIIPIMDFVETFPNAKELKEYLLDT